MIRIEHFNHTLWGYVVRDGAGFCHWGGRRYSELLIRLADVKRDDQILEICCGRGGLLRLIGDRARLVCELDLSLQALRHVKSHAVLGDALDLPFATGSFTKVIAQDADAWLHSEKGRLMAEIYRVMTAGSHIVYQSYVESRTMSVPDSQKTAALLKKCGYSHTDLPYVENIEEMFASAGFRILRHRSLHQRYARENQLMIQKFKATKGELSIHFPLDTVNALGELLEWEASLFRRQLWTGVLVVAEKQSPETQVLKRR